MRYSRLFSEYIVRVSISHEQHAKTAAELAEVRRLKAERREAALKVRLANERLRELEKRAKR